MIERLQNALRDDPRIRARLTEAYRDSGARGRAIVIWNGDWVLSPGQDGKGLAGVRQAVAVVVGFSPRECKSQAVRGYVVVTLSDDPGAPKLALGTGQVTPLQMVRAYITWNFHGRAVPGPERQGTLMRTLAQLGARPCLSLELIEECRGHDLRLQRMFQDAFRMPDARDHVVTPGVVRDAFGQIGRQ